MEILEYEGIGRDRMRDRETERHRDEEREKWRGREAEKQIHMEILE